MKMIKSQLFFGLDLIFTPSTAFAFPQTMVSYVLYRSHVQRVNLNLYSTYKRLHFL